MADEIEAGALLAMLREADPTITRAKLHRWQNAGLLKPPRKPGLGRGAGSVSFYPSEAIEIVKTIAVLLRERRDFDWVGWKLWLMDYPVAERFWRPRLQRSAELWDRIVPVIRDLLDADDDRLAEEVKRWLEHRTDSAMFASIRKAIGADRFEAAMVPLLELAAGFEVSPSHDPLSAEYREAVDRMDLILGLRRARTDYLPGGPPLLGDNRSDLSSDYFPLLSALGRQLSRVSFVEFLNNISEAEFSEAKRELVNILGHFAVMNAVFGQVLGPDAFGLARVAKLRGLLSNGEMPLLIIGWAIWRQNSGVTDAALAIRAALEAQGLPSVTNMERVSINPPADAKPTKSLKKTRRVYPHDEWANSRAKS